MARRSHVIDYLTMLTNRRPITMGRRLREIFLPINDVQV